MATKSKLHRWLPGLKLRTKVSLGIVIPLLLILGAFTGIESARHREVVITNLSLLASRLGQVIEDDLRQHMLKSDFDGLQALLDSVNEADDFRVIYLLDTNGQVIFSPQGDGVGLQLYNSAADCQPCHRLAPAQRPSSVAVTAEDGQRVFRSMHPIENSPDCARCHDSKDRLIGLLLTDIPMAPLEAPLSAHLRESLLWWAGTILVVVLVVNLVMNRMVLQRLEGLAANIRGFGQGRLPAPVSDGQSDEIGQLSTAFHAMAVQVEARNTENLTLSERLQRQSTQRGELLKRLITIQEDERKRVARELHDELGQALGGLNFRVEAIQRMVDSDAGRAEKELALTRKLIEEATDQMHNLIYALRPSILDDLGLSAALRSHAERLLECRGIAFDFDSSELDGRLPSEIETALYRIFQEALNNIVRHSGATQVTLSLSSRDGTLEAEIIDNGDGFDPQAIRDLDQEHGWGLLGMQERVALVGGHLDVHSRSGSGTRIHLSIPL